MHDGLYSEGTTPDEATIGRLAGSLHLEMPAFTSCIRGQLKATINEDAKTSRTLGVRSTPAFLVGTRLANGMVRVQRTIAGAMAFSEFEAVLDPLLVSR
jgi:protein-disulfide isomerase